MSNLRNKLWVAKYAPDKLSDTIMTDEIKTNAYQTTPQRNKGQKFRQ